MVDWRIETTNLGMYDSIGFAFVMDSVSVSVPQGVFQAVVLLLCTVDTDLVVSTVSRSQDGCEVNAIGLPVIDSLDVVDDGCQH